MAVTRRVVEYAHDRGVWVEAELGRLAGVEETVSSRESVYTDPEEAETFVARTGCDSLAIAIGTVTAPASFRGRRGLISSALTPLPPVCRAFRWCCTARRACRRTASASRQRRQRRECEPGRLRPMPEDLLAAPPLPPFARSILIRICGWPSPPPSGPCLRSVPKPSILAPI